MKVKNIFKYFLYFRVRVTERRLKEIFDLLDHILNDCNRRDGLV